MRLQLHALAYDLGNFLRTPATAEPIKDWSLPSLKEKEKLIEVGAKVASHGRYVASKWPEVRSHGKCSRRLLIAKLTAAATASVRRSMVMRQKAPNTRSTSKCQNLPGVPVAGYTSRLSCKRAESARIFYVSSGAIWGIQ